MPPGQTDPFIVQLEAAPSRRQILAKALPIILANSATPLLGLTDLAVMGHYGSVEGLGAIAIGSLLFSFLYWGFGFLRMNTSGYVAQALGRNDALAIVAVLARALLLALVIGLLLIVLQWPLLHLALLLFGAGQGVEQIAADYFFIRIWSAPATLAQYVLMGFFIGSGASRSLLVAQLLLNGLNIVLDIFFAGVLGWGAVGIAAGTAMAEWLALILVARMAWRQLRTNIYLAMPTLKEEVCDLKKLRAVMMANADILLRTIALLSGFALFTDQGARFSTVTLAANHVLLQLISFSAFFLDGFAYVAESLTGRAFGAGNKKVFVRVVQRSSQVAGMTALMLAVLLLVGGDFFIQQLTDLASVRAAASEYLPYCAAYVMVSFMAFQLDGIFIGATQTRALRNAALAALACFALVCVLLVSWLGNTGLWVAFIFFVLARALLLACYFSRVFRF